MAADARPKLHLSVLPGEYSVARLEPGHALEPWMTTGSHWCIARTPAELSVVAESAHVPPGVRVQAHFRMIRFPSPLPFDMVGVLASVCEPLAHASIPIFAISTFDTDYVLISASDLERATRVLQEAGHMIAIATEPYSCSIRDQ